MKHKVHSIRTFIGAQNFGQSRSFYQELGFEEFVISRSLSFFRLGNLGFYLQDYYVKDWVDNSMLFLEVYDADRDWEELSALQLDEKYKGVRLLPVQAKDWGKECFLHDPSGVLWHIGHFNNYDYSNV